jgi:IMP dehydrogenase/GMP reductase
MAHYLDEESRTFNEFLLLPNLTRRDCVPMDIRLHTPLVRHARGEQPTLSLRMPLVSAIMQAVSSVEMAMSLARRGGLCFLHHRQPVESQARQVRAVKQLEVGRHPDQLLDAAGRYAVGAGINTHDFAERVPALAAAEVDVLCVDSSDGYSEWQADTLRYVRERFPDVPVGGGNVVDAAAFAYLADAGASFVKVGIGGGSVSTSRDHKGIGRGQASALRDVAQARDERFARTGEYIPICSDGGILLDYHMALALAMGADFLMLGRYFARFDQSPGRLVRLSNTYVKEYWGEGSPRARTAHLGGSTNGEEVFEEGVEGYVPYAGDIAVALDASLARIRATMIGCGVLDLPAFRRTARIVRVSQQSFLENTHGIRLREQDEMRLA